MAKEKDFEDIMRAQFIGSAYEFNLFYEWAVEKLSAMQMLELVKEGDALVSWSEEHKSPQFKITDKGRERVKEILNANAIEH